MKQRIIISPFAIILTVVVSLTIIISAASSFKNGELPVAWTLTSILLVILIPSLFYSPVYSAADNAGVYVRHPLRTSFYPIEEIEKIEVFAPTMAEKCIVGARGYFGYWGFFYDGGIKKYVACYGKASQCVLMTLKNGKKYVIGAEHNQEFADYIQKMINER
ncbi:MAG: hypothetical protein HDS93_02730 [Bacteroidales bacterium]|nr:hypothetical protein [Bacteroidales bacterium]MBD5208714.1 hypothetical protein [Bacteroidales bacterium]